MFAALAGRFMSGERMLYVAIVPAAVLRKSLRFKAGSPFYQGGCYAALRC